MRSSAPRTSTSRRVQLPGASQWSRRSRRVVAEAGLVGDGAIAAAEDQTMDQLVEAHAVVDAWSVAAKVIL
jgi:hypothetical protein